MNVCCMLYAVGCASWATLMPSWGYVVKLLGLLGCTLGQSWAMSGPYWGSVGGLGCTWVHLGAYGLGFRV